jgi:hypothetical protein
MKYEILQQNFQLEVNLAVYTRNRKKACDLRLYARDEYRNHSLQRQSEFVSLQINTPGKVKNYLQTHMKSIYCGLEKTTVHNRQNVC